jgi:hypothetical protein
MNGFLLRDQRIEKLASPLTPYATVAMMQLKQVRRLGGGASLTLGKNNREPKTKSN